MLVVKIELWPGGVEKRAREIGRMVIAKVGGDDDLGDYEVREVHVPMGYERVTLPRTGRIERHPRRRESVWKLVKKAIASVEK